MNKPSPDDSVLGLLAGAFDRIAGALERIAPPAPAKPDFSVADAYIWSAATKKLEPVARVNRVEMFLLKGIMQVMFSLRYRPNAGWGWTLAAGILAIVLALMIISSWPFSGLWVPGTLAGISLIFSGWSYIMIAMAGRRLASL